MGSNHDEEGSSVMCLSGHSVRCFRQDRDPGSVPHSIDGRGQIYCAQIRGVF
jgi:hypothetical protein